jgi:voltage-gated potassium channel
MTKQAVQRLLNRRWFESVLGGLIVISVALTVVEISTPNTRLWTVYAVHGISALFVVELAIRWYVAPTRRRFVRDYWTDCLSVVPLLAIGGAPEPPTWLGALALLRIIRLFRLLQIARHLVLLFPRVLRQGAREMFFASGFVLLAVVLASSALVTFEREANPALDSFPKAFWFSVYSVVAAEPIPNPPMTIGGHIAAIFVILTGLFAFATVVGTISALVAERINSGDLVMDWEDLKDHTIVCGWSRKANIILKELLGAFPDDDRPLVVVAEFEQGHPPLDPALRARVQFLNDDFTKLEALEKAGVKRAARAIILADTARGRKERDADARTVLCALTIERLNPDVYTCAEIHRRENAHHLAMGGVNDFIVAGEHSAFLLAQSTITRGVMKVFSELLTHTHGNRFSRCSVPAKWKGRTFIELMTHVKQKHDALLVAVSNGDDTIVNPTDYVFNGGEDIVLISQANVHL